MAKNSENVVMAGTSGKLADQLVVRRERDGDLVYAKKPRKTEKEPHVNVVKQRTRFGEAAHYAKAALKVPDIRAVYEAKAKAKGGRESAFNVAIGDYCNVPQVRMVNTEGYTGQPQSTIVIRAIDDVKVAAVYVTVQDPNGAVVEQGAAVQNDMELDWTYTATAMLATLEGSLLTIKVSDLPGNQVTEEHLL
ncbi:Ig-like domain-containing protein [Chitinophaga cymbidii]|uniref:Uncharacterized protein n=1 Tax=Chitinophaga cymbidii TaxID=1096750 RepID=A0A512RJ59_9BACT|nr:hypothetical protein [Chitinophaga cymbidii]GEP95710.1 hypothetical protein CCY01nite_19700 [Chitinophaga cymbidii]